MVEEVRSAGISIAAKGCYVQRCPVQGCTVRECNIYIYNVGETLCRCCGVCVGGLEINREIFSIGMSCLEVSCEYVGSHSTDDVDVQHRDVLFGGVLYISVSM